MIDHKKGEFVLLEGRYEGETETVGGIVPIVVVPHNGAEKCVRPRARYIHSWPGESVADLIAERDALLEELKLRDFRDDCESRASSWTKDPRPAIRRFRDAREAAAKRDVPDDGKELRIILKLDADVITENVIKLTPKILRRLGLD